MDNFTEAFFASCFTHLLAQNVQPPPSQIQMDFLSKLSMPQNLPVPSIPQPIYNLNPIASQNFSEYLPLPRIVNPLPRKNNHKRNAENTTEHIINQLEKAATSQKNSLQVVLEQIHNQHDCLIETFDEIMRDKDELSEKVAELERIVHDKLKSRPSSPRSRSEDVVSQKKSRRRAGEIKKEFKCPYENCAKTYGTEVSLNLHMKLKHNGGSKTERELQAKKILEAQLNNSEPPQIDINFPPGFLATVAESLGKDSSYQFRKMSEASYVSTEEQSL